MSHLEEAASLIRERASGSIAIGAVAGSGLAGLAEILSGSQKIPYAEIPHFPLPSVAGHRGVLHLGQIAGKTVAILEGRVHAYEGVAMSQVVFAVRALALSGAQAFLLTSSAGGINPNLEAGDLLLHSDYLNLMGTSPLIGPNDESLGPRFPVMFDAYDAEARGLAQQIAGRLGISLKEGVYAAILGPAFLSRAESRLLSILGADAVGMSTVPEVIALRHMGARVLAISAITDQAGPDVEHHASHEEVLLGAERASGALFNLTLALLAQL